MYPAYPNCLPTARYLNKSSEAFGGTYVTYRYPRPKEVREYLCQWTLEGDGGRFKVFYIFPDTQRFTDESKIDFGSIIWCNGRCWARLAIEIPRNLVSRHATNLRILMMSGRDEGQGTRDCTMNRTVPSIV
jgi:hypothetical protein